MSIASSRGRDFTSDGFTLVGSFNIGSLDGRQIGDYWLSPRPVAVFSLQGTYFSPLIVDLSRVGFPINLPPSFNLSGDNCLSHGPAVNGGNHRTRPLVLDDVPPAKPGIKVRV